MIQTPFLSDAYVRSVLTRKIAALEVSTRRSGSQSQVRQLNGLMRTYHGILTPTMTPETGLEVLSDVTGESSLNLESAMVRRQQLMSTLTNIMKKTADAAASITANIK